MNSAHQSIVISKIRAWGIPLLAALLLNGLLVSFIPGLMDPISERKPDIKSVQGFRMVRIKPPVPRDKAQIFPEKRMITSSEKQSPLKNSLMADRAKPDLTLDLKTDLPAPTYSRELKVKLNFDLPTPGTTFYSLDEIDNPLMPLVRTPPLYPRQAQRRGIQGWVDVEFIVNISGRVETVTIIQAEPPGIYEQSVIRAVSSWRFSPGTVSGKPVNIRIRQRLQFRLGHEK